MKDKKKWSELTRRDVLKIGGTAIGAAAFGKVRAFEGFAADGLNFKNSAMTKVSKVDFLYAFGAPHRITTGRPDACDRTLLDVKPGTIKMSWSYDNLTMGNYPPLAFRTPSASWNIQVTPEIDGKPFTNSRWTRLDDILPALGNVYEKSVRVC